MECQTETQQVDAFVYLRLRLARPKIHHEASFTQIQPSATFMQFSGGYSFPLCFFGNSFMITGICMFALRERGLVGETSQSDENRKADGTVGLNLDLPQVARFFIFGSIEITLKLRAKDRNRFEIARGRPERPPGICPCVAREQSEVHKIEEWLGTSDLFCAAILFFKPARSLQIPIQRSPVHQIKSNEAARSRIKQATWSKSRLNHAPATQYFGTRLPSRSRSLTS